jgi:hypothetical protein
VYVRDDRAYARGCDDDDRPHGDDGGGHDFAHVRVHSYEHVVLFHPDGLPFVW